LLKPLPDFQLIVVAFSYLSSWKVVYLVVCSFGQTNDLMMLPSQKGHVNEIP
jgi:hypothetical protein